MYFIFFQHKPSTIPLSYLVCVIISIPLHDTFAFFCSRACHSTVLYTLPRVCPSSIPHTLSYTCNPFPRACRLCAVVHLANSNTFFTILTALFRSTPAPALRYINNIYTAATIFVHRLYTLRNSLQCLACSSSTFTIFHIMSFNAPRS